MLEQALWVCIVASLLLYGLTGGADFGGGIWDLLAAGPRATRQREAIGEAIGPIWEANHVWLILVIVLLFTAFPTGFSAAMTALNIPLTAMLLGIVLRGSAFVFRQYGSGPAAPHRLWGTAFGAASFFTPFFQGVIIGALASGRIHVENGRVTSGFFAGWLTPFALGCGVFALALFAFLAATYLTLETKRQPDLQNDFRCRALGAGLACIPIAAVVFLLSRQEAPRIFRGLMRGWTPLLLGATALFALGALVTLWRRKFSAARVAGAGAVVCILAGGSLAQYPCLVSPDVTIFNAHAPEKTLCLLLMALGLGAILLFPSLFFLFHIFKGERRT
jgi:cytochrome d ubiquinol oxidase subunit II